MTSVRVDAPRWAADPAGRNAQRYWDGARWTDFVAGPVGGTPTVDPLPANAAFASPGASLESLVADPGPAGTDSLEPAASADGLASPAAVATRPPGWDRDPTGRHAQRYWDGTAWTEHVAGPAGGAPTTDPLGADPQPTTVPAPSSEEPAVPSGAELAVPPDEIVVANPPAAAGEPGHSPPRWAPDPSGRSPQRYWNGAAWTAFVAGAAGGDATIDPGTIESWPAPDPSGSERFAVAPEHAGAPLADARRRRTRRRRLVAALAVVVLVAAGAGTALLAGVVDSSGSPIRNAAHRRPAPTKPTPAAGPKVAGTSVTAAPAGTKPAVVDATKDPCALLNQAEIATATAFSVNPGQAISGGCAWRGAVPFANESNAQDRETLAGQEGVILTVQPKGTRHPSVTCTASIPGISTAGGVCTIAGAASDRYAMFDASGNVVVEIAVHTANPVSEAGLEQLARAAHQRAG